MHEQIGKESSENNQSFLHSTDVEYSSYVIVEFFQSKLVFAHELGQIAFDY